MRDVMVVVGTRPEVIKMAPVVRALRSRGAAVVVVASGQHRDLLGQAARAVGMSIDVPCDAVQETLDLPQKIDLLTQRIGRAIDARPTSWVLVHGDTATTLSGALAARARGMAVGHVEAGLRTGDLRDPFPEEWIRTRVDQMSSLCFAPSDLAKQALLAEGISNDRIEVTGNTVVDALLLARPLAASALDRSLLPFRELSASFADATRKVVLMTIHRSENRSRVADMVDVAKTLARDGHTVVWPVHPHPTFRTLAEGNRSFWVLPPLAYPAFLGLLKRSDLVLTDSGGVQEEAALMRRPVLVLRRATERPDVHASGVVRVVGTRVDAVVDAAREWLEVPPASHDASILGPPGASQRIADRLLRETPALQGDVACA